MQRFYITTPIYYVNAVPHLGTFYSTVVADALARYHRARGHETYFLTGTDEHGQKIERMAKAQGLEPRSYCDGVVDQFKATWKRADVSYNRFIRTTDTDHRAAVEEMWRRMLAAGDIYPHEYDGLYCVGCEDWKTDDELSAGPAGEKLCPIHGKPVERVKEKNYFFRLSRYQDRLLQLYQQPDFIRPESRRNEVAEFVKGGLRDISVSRLSVKWGIPVPDDPAHVIYVWIDALTNYLTALGGPGPVERKEGAGRLWEDCYHLIAKDILRFHAVYWPAMLMSAGLPAPKGIFCHGYLTVKGQKISKSIPATRVDPNAIADELGVDPLRYFVLREYTLGGDGDFTYEALFGRYEADLGNDLGNLLNRTVSMAHRYLNGSVPRATPDPELEALAQAKKKEAEGFWEGFAPSRALEATWEIVRAANRYIERSAPWKLAKDPHATNALGRVLADCCEAVRWAALMIAPAMPERSAEILRQLNVTSDSPWPGDWAWPSAGLGEPKPIFPRIEPARQAELIARWMPPDAQQSAASVPATSTPGGAQITRADFEKLELRAAKVVACERVPKTDKLLKLTLDIGAEQRTVVSGIAGPYQPEELVGQTVVYLANLAPAKIRGVISQGMILAAGEAEVLGLCGLDREVAPGTPIR
jgi:methionyl-tRNA synthetase